MQLEDLYTPRVLALATGIPRLGRLDDPHAAAAMTSRLCGSRISVGLRLEGGVIGDFAQEITACALAQASAAVLGGNIIGKTPEEMRAVRDGLAAMLRGSGGPPGGDWEELSVFLPVRDYPPRHDSVLLPFDAVCRALEQVDG